MRIFHYSSYYIYVRKNNTTTCTLQPINPSSMTPFQHACIIFFILFAFFKHIKREKFKTNNHIIYAIIIYWEISHVMSYNSWSVSHATTHRNPSHQSHDQSQPIATNRISHTTNRNPNAISHATPQPIASVTRHRNPSHQSRDTSHQSRVSPASCTHL